MTVTTRFWRYVVTLLAFAAMVGVGAAAELNPAAVTTNCRSRFPGGR